MVAIMGRDAAFRRWWIFTDTAARPTCARQVKVGVHAWLRAENDTKAIDDFFPATSKPLAASEGTGFGRRSRAPISTPCERAWSALVGNPEEVRKRFCATAKRWAASHESLSKWTWPSCPRQNCSARSSSWQRRRARFAWKVEDLVFGEIRLAS